MAEGRMLKKRIAKSSKFAALKSDKARLLYLLLLPHVDCEGKMEANSDIIKGNACPYIKTLTKLGIIKHLKHLHDSGLIILYSVENELYLQITRFEDFNRIDKKKEAVSQIPPPTPEQGQTNSPPTPPEVKVKLREVKVKEKRRGKNPKRRFTPPTLSQVQDYIKEKKYSVDPQKFFDYFTAGEWRDSTGKAVKNWKQKIITWDNHSSDGKVEDNKKCVVCQGEGYKCQNDDKGRKRYLCKECLEAAGVGGFRNRFGLMNLTELERKILEAKAKR